MFKKLAIPARVPILYLILGVLILVSVVPMYFYAGQVMSINRVRLKTNEMYLQNTITQSVGEDIEHRQRSLETMLGNLASAIVIASGGDLHGEHVSAPELRALLEKFVSSSPDVGYATVLNADAKGISAGRLTPDDFVHKELERAFIAGSQGRAYTGQALTIETGRDRRIVVLFSTPISAGGRFIGMLGAAIDLNFLRSRLQEVAKFGGLLTYVVDRQGRLVAAATSNYATGQDMTKFEIVKNFVESGGKAVVATKEFSVTAANGQKTAMLGTFSPVPSLEWAVIAQKPQSDAYRDVIDMQSQGITYAIYAVVLAVIVGVFAARRITGPLDILTNSSRAIARGDFSQRVQLTSRTEFGELAQTFNHMTEDLERFVADLKRAAEENRALFMGSIQMLAGAVDEKDPYTRGHSDRVTRYSTHPRHGDGNDGRADRGRARLGATARRGKDRHRGPHPEEARSADAGRVRGHEDAHHARRQHPASGAAVEGNDPRHRTAPRIARRPRLSVWPQGRRTAAGAAHHCRGRYL